MWASWCLGSIGGLAEVVRRGDSVGKRDINNLCGIRGLVGGGVLLRRWGMEVNLKNACDVGGERVFERSTSSTADSERKRRLGVLLAIYISFWQETKNFQK